MAWLQLIFFLTLSAVGLGIKCDWVKTTNDKCVKLINCDPDTGNQLRVFEDCNADDELLVVKNGTKLVEDPGCDVLSFSGTTISLKMSLDAETDNELINCKIVSGNIPTFVKASDVNEFIPAPIDGISFSDIEFDENLATEDLVHFTYTDGDSGEGATLKAEFVDKGLADTFDIKTSHVKENTTFTIGTKALDFEDMRSYYIMLDIISTDERENTLNATYTVKLNVIDMGDNPPTWTKIVYSTEFDEGVNDRPVFSVTARDGDPGIDNAIEYSIISGNELGYFAIDEQIGEVTSVKAIDREALDNPDFVLEIMALEVDGNEPVPDPNNSTTKTTVYIKDVNNKIPKFNELSYNVTMFELTSEGVNMPIDIDIFVFDMDTADKNGDYTITSDYEEDLHIQPKDSRLNTTLSLTAIWIEDTIFDYDESQEPIIIQLTATEKQNKTHTSVVNLTITLKDKNDNVPEFGNSSYVVEVEESEIEGYIVETVEATDFDFSDDYGTDSIRYFINSCPELVIDQKTGDISLAANNSLDYETKTKFTCQIEARDNQGKTALYRSGFSNITVQVIDVVDSPPTLDKLPGVNVLENSKKEVTITGKDQDEDAQITFDINVKKSTASFDNTPVDFEKVKDWFEIVTMLATSGGDSSRLSNGDYSGLLKIGSNELPDREVADRVDLFIEIIDENTEFNDNCTSGMLTITIKDENDCTPEFDEHPDTYEVKENAAGDTLIAEFTVHDPDTNDFVTFNISDDSLVHLEAEIDPFTTTLHVVEGVVIDAETIPQFNVNITVEDSAGNSNFIEITIDVKDLNDNIPKMIDGVCDQVYNISEVSGLEVYDIYEEEITKNGTEVWIFTALDLDAGEVHSKVGYTLRNEGQPDIKNLRLPFKINNDTGKLTVFLDPVNSKTLNREVDSEWDLFVIAHDNCDPGEELDCKVLSSGNCKLHINVMDVNDNAPNEFRWTGYPDNIVVNEFMKLGDSATVSTGGDYYEIFASDTDEINTDNTCLDYTVLSVTKSQGTEDQELFTAETQMRYLEDDRKQYYARLVANKDFTGLRGSYNIHLMAEDAGEPSLNGTVNITLTIEDANDHPPKFHYWGCLNETKQVITMVENTEGVIGQCFINNKGDSLPINIQVIDEDLGKNKDFSVSIDVDKSNTTGNQTKDFSIRIQEGSENVIEIVADKPIDRESGNLYNLSLYAIDKGEPKPLESWSWVQIIVTNTFEFTPYFCEGGSICTETIYILENDTEAMGSFKIATDLDDTGVDPTDIHNYDIVYYSITGGDKEMFQLIKDNETRLQVTKELDRESVDEYYLDIDTFNDNSGTEPFPKNSTLHLTIKVLDANDNTPVFTKPIIGSFTENYQSGQRILVMKADDLDLNETLAYTIEDDFTWVDGPAVPPKTPFLIGKIENNTAELLMNFDPTGVNNGYCLFTLNCMDNNGMHTGTTQVKVFAITVDFIVPVYFKNTKDEVQPLKSDIEDIFTKAFGYDCSIDGIEEGTINAITDANAVTNADDEVIVKMHFINNEKDEPVSPQTIYQIANRGTVMQELFTELGFFNLNLKSVGENDGGGGGTGKETLLMIVSAVVGFVLVSLLILMMIAYFVRTTTLERQVRVLSATTFGSHGSGLNQMGTEMSVIPGSNKFLGEGSNPLYNLPEAELRNDDTDSVDSGDSVLIGVEENPQFRSKGVPEKVAEAGLDVFGFDNQGYGRSIDDISVPDPFVGGTRTNPLLEMSSGTGEDVDLGEALKNYDMFIRRSSSGSDMEPSSSYNENFSF